MPSGLLTCPVMVGARLERGFPASCILNSAAADAEEQGCMGRG
jgi:hypothetical protein